MILVFYLFTTASIQMVVPEELILDKNFFGFDYTEYLDETEDNELFLFSRYDSIHWIHGKLRVFIFIKLSNLTGGIVVFLEGGHSFQCAIRYASDLKLFYQEGAKYFDTTFGGFFNIILQGIYERDYQLLRKDVLWDSIKPGEPTGTGCGRKRFMTTRDEPY